ncbi:protein of unknown function [Sporobacter termitidis DSM 10068]|uniref:DUF4474 domain-containing protein n=1 Tax=Sporobacter termitidis DSM 10068 TaxID=1123282 RepID=A0A1M5W8Y0_9FIRM|nr:DUF4474 domain-containing protein [Sporobacter termitidis]SHH83925.1 protein of unknown function [Sporobacter termitidis DSM 10068]
MVTFGSPLFWVLFSSAVLAACIFIFSIIRRHIIDRRLGGPDAAAQGQVLSSASQIDVLNDILADTGYAYDWRQNVFYSKLNTWQRKFGYCSLYDETSAPLGIVIDCEPIYFDYGGKKWLLELWKGQYGMAVGAEIGIYNTTGPALDIPGVFNGTFYDCAGDEDMLSMTYTLFREGKALFRRAARHWWLTGFMLGEYAAPPVLSMEASITFRDRDMRNAFLVGLTQAGYGAGEYRYSGNTVLVLYTRPHSRQPLPRRGLLGRLALHYDKWLVRRYKKLTKGLANMTDILETLRRKSPLLYNLALNLGRPRKFYKAHDKLRPYIEGR